MAGNAIEEALFRQIDNPSHTDPARVGFLGGAVFGFAVAVGVTSVVPTTTFGIVFIWLLVGLFSGVFLTRRLNARLEKRKERALFAARAAHEAETARQIAEMKRKETRRRG